VPKQSTFDDGRNQKQQINFGKQARTKEHNKNNKQAWRKTQLKTHLLTKHHGCEKRKKEIKINPDFAKKININQGKSQCNATWAEGVCERIVLTSLICTYHQGNKYNNNNQPAMWEECEKKFKTFFMCTYL